MVVERCVVGTIGTSHSVILYNTTTKFFGNTMYVCIS